MTVKKHVARLRNALIRRIASSLSQESAVVLEGDPDLDPELARLARRAAADGVVLLKNDGGTLPLSRTREVAVFGRVQINYFAVGYGSGGDVNEPYCWNLLDALVDQGEVRLNEPLADRYRAWSAANRPDEGIWGRWPRYFDEMPLDAETVRSARATSEVALVVIGRAAGESRENVLEEGSYYLTGPERRMLDLVTAQFERTVVVIDTGNVIDLSWIEGYGDRLGAVVLAWQGGMEGARGLADVLTGAVAPSGRLTDTIARRYEDYPSAKNFGGRVFNAYVEDIYVGYRYFETFAPQKVLYPFGFGLSYTSFSIETDAARSDEEGFELAAVVTNVGSRPGREVVQVYAERPDGTLGNPARTLVAFQKTGELAPGASERLAFRIPWGELASYDDTGSSGHPHAWVLEAGTYRLHVGANVRDAVVAAESARATTELVRACAPAAAPAPKHPFRRMTLGRDADGRPRVAYAAVPTAGDALKERILSRIPAALPAAERPVVFRDVVRGDATAEELAATLSADELSDLCRGAITMNSPLGTPGNAGVFGGVSESLRARGIPPVTATDGPSGIRGSFYASLLPCGTALASSWDAPLVEELLGLVGEEMVRKGSDVLLSPGMNIHRDPLGGRAFEYYSEDPFLTGAMASATVRGVQSRGVAACPKHFACNNQERFRATNDSRVSERALREIYLRGFEIVVREAKPLALMTAYNKVNGVWAYFHHDLCVTILRDEWGYEGMVMTDWWTRAAADPLFPALRNNAYRVRAGVDVLMPGSDGRIPNRGSDGTVLSSLAADGGLTLGEVQRSAAAVIRMAASLSAGRAARIADIESAGA